MNEIWDINKLKEKIEEFKKNNYSSKPVSEVVEDLYDFYNSYDIFTANMGSVLFRVRKINNGCEHNTSRDIWCPPAKCVTQVGRANDIGESIFYGSFDPLTAILETNVIKNQNFTIGIYYLDALELWNQTSIVIKASKTRGRQSKIYDEYSIMLSEFMVNEFTKEVLDENGYKISCAMAKILLEIPYKDSIIYPSMKNRTKINIAIVEESARKRLRLYVVFKCKLLDYLEDGSAKVEIMSYDNVSTDRTDLNYKETNHIETITHSTWVEKELTFDDLFSNDKILSPEDMLKIILKNKQKQNE